MKTDCLTEQDLILLHYGDAPGALTDAADGHLAACADCRTRQLRLVADLARLPLVGAVDPPAVTRVCARVGARLERRRRWLPVAGAVLAGAAALAVAIVVWTPAETPRLAANPPQETVVRQASLQPTLDLELLDQLDLLEELETLQAIEGV